MTPKSAVNEGARLDPIFHRVLDVMDKQFGPSEEFWVVAEAVYIALSDAYQVGQES